MAGLSEAQHQANVIKWTQQPAIRRQWPELALLHHIPNGGTRDPIEAKHLKQQGVKSGVPDLFLPVPRGKYHGLYIEMKTEHGHTSDSQEWWGDKLSAQGLVTMLQRNAFEEKTLIISDRGFESYGTAPGAYHGCQLQSLYLPHLQKGR